jgi:hypothetical protein
MEDVEDDGQDGQGGREADFTPESPPRAQGGPKTKPRESISASAGQGAIVPSFEGKKGKGVKKERKKEKEAKQESDLAVAYDTLANYCLTDSKGTREMFKIPIRFLRYALLGSVECAFRRRKHFWMEMCLHKNIFVQSVFHF